jgi:hypothetical protein
VLLVQARGHAEGVLAADGDERVEAVLLERAEDRVNAAVELVRVRPRGAENRSAARQNPGYLTRAERLELSFDEPAPALADADDLPLARVEPARDRPDDRVQPGAVAAAGQDPRPH